MMLIVYLRKFLNLHLTGAGVKSASTFVFDIG